MERIDIEDAALTAGNSAMEWTDDQLNAINSTKNAILVSAAAGSGKTRVLTQRVIRLIKQGRDIRRMLIVTFTNAAAGEMKKRIIKALTDEAQRQDNPPETASYLYEQAEYADYASISTFHAFCIELLRENFIAADTSPNFKVLGDNEAAALANEAIREVLDGLYEKKDEDLIRLLARYTSKFDESALIKMLNDIYDKARSQPAKFEWITKGGEKNEIPAGARAGRLKDLYQEKLREKIKQSIGYLEYAVKLEEIYDDKKAQSHLGNISELEKAYDSSLNDAYDIICNINIGNFSRTNKKMPIEFLNEIIPAINNAKKIKDFIQIMGDPSNIEDELKHTDRDAKAIAEILKKFDNVYTQKKKERNGLDFDDTLLKTIDVLEKNPDIAQRYDYIFIDEYQDTNPVQQRIIDLLAADNPAANLFMVGDMKQSIYKFRNAEPSFFKGKAENYKKDGGMTQLIHMNENFRSCKAVTDAVNGVMESVMSEEFGDVEYGETERLISKKDGGSAELLLGEYNPDVLSLDINSGRLTEKELKADIEAQAVVSSIVKTLNEKDVNGEYKYSPGDIAILARKMKDNAVINAIMKRLRQRGIWFSIKKGGVSDTPQIELFVNLLKIINNPTNDIALASVLKSDIGGFDDEQLARIRICSNETGNKSGDKGDKLKKSFFATLNEFAEKNKDNKEGEKAQSFLNLIKKLQLRSKTDSLDDFINSLRDRFEFDYSYAFVKNGNVKQDIFEKFMQLVSEICAYSENSLYKLLYELEAGRKRTGNYSNIKPEDNAQQAVSIMTMHKSKGLEYPIVYLVDLNKDLTKSDSKAAYKTDPKWGLILPYRDEQTRVKKDGTALAIFKERIKAEEKSEYLRLLYVAMTRAKERLYMSAVVEKAEEEESILEKDIVAVNENEMLKWLVASKPEKYGIKINTDVVSNYIPEEQKAKKTSADIEERIDGLAEKGEGKRVYTPPLVKPIPKKISVSDVKARQMDISKKKFRTVKSFFKENTEEYADKEITGAALGTLIHRVMEYVAKSDLAADKAALYLFENSIINETEYDAVIKNEYMIKEFINSDLYERMKKSEKILEEQRFLLRVPADNLGYDSCAHVTLQGVLDAAFLEDGEWVLIDYKTDNVAGEELEKRADFYRIQLDLYSDALKQITGVPVKERYLYFLRPGELRAV